jgi:protein involved in polysaccharide export with SLBB domain
MSFKERSLVASPLRLLVVCGIPFVAAACAVTPPGEVNLAFKDLIDQRHQQYVFKDGDTIEVRVYDTQEDDINQGPLLILPDGKSDLFFMDNHEFVGKTIPQIEAELRARIATEVKNSEISLRVKPAGEVAHLIGQFERPGLVNLTTRTTLHEAISAVGGMKITGDTDYALLRRPVRNPRHPDQFRIDLNDESEAIFLLPGDQVVLGRTFLAEIVNYYREYFLSLFPSGIPYYTLAAY